MVVEQWAAKIWRGLVADPKPTGSSVVNGSLYIETNGSNIWVYNGALSTWQLPYNQSPGGAVYSGYLTGTTFKLLNNVTGNVDYTADNAVNCIPAINSAFANMQNIPNIDTVYGGDIELMAGKYRCTTTLDMTIEATNRNALGLKSNTWGTVLDFTPGAALTDAIKIKGTGSTIEGLNIKPNSNITNMIHIQSVAAPVNIPKGAFGKIERCLFFGPNHVEGGSFSPTVGMVGIYHDNVATQSAWFWDIDHCIFGSLTDGIKSEGTSSTSLNVEASKFLYCDDGIDIANAQHLISGCWFQGQSMRAGVHLRGTATLNTVTGCEGEMLDGGTVPGGTNVGTVVLDSGASRNWIQGIRNWLANTTNTFAHSVYDNSGQVSNTIMFHDIRLNKGRIKNPRFEGLAGIISESGGIGGQATFNMEPIASGQLSLLNLLPSIAGIPADTAARVGMRWHNMVPATDQEYLDLLSLGTNGYYFNSTKSGAGVARQIRFAMAGGTVLTFRTDADLEFADNVDLVLSTVTGSRIGTLTTQKLGFYGKAPVTQRAAIAAPTAGTTIDAESRTAINSIRQVLIDLGLTA